MKLQALFTRMLRTSLAIAVGAMLFIPRPLLAQVDTGSILGTITDPSGAVIGGATVTLTNEGTSATLSTTVESDGSYKFTPVRIGSYKVSASSQGFQTTEQKNIVVNVGSSVLVNFVLRPGAVTETVEVTTSTPVLETQDASVGQVVNSRNVNNLPLNGRNFTFLAQLSAGVNSPQADTRGNAASGAFSANGSRPAQNNYLLDGIDNNSDTVDFLNGTNFVVLPPVDAIQEFKVQTTNFSAEYGRSGAAVLNATIKSGTNAWHGAGWEFFRNDKLDAADYFERVGNTTKKGELRLNQFGVAIGGPVIKNKVFIFGDYEGLRRRQGSPHTGSVPTNLERSSGYTDFTELIQSGTQTDASRTEPCRFGTILDPATTRASREVSFAIRSWDPLPPARQATANFTSAACNLNILPAGRLDANAIKLLNLYPTPTSGGISSNYIVRQRSAKIATPLTPGWTSTSATRIRFSIASATWTTRSSSLASSGAWPMAAVSRKVRRPHWRSRAPWPGPMYFLRRWSTSRERDLNYLHTTRVSPAANDLSDLPGQFGIAGYPSATRKWRPPRVRHPGIADPGQQRLPAVG